jgi:hypothetical protein
MPKRLFNILLLIEDSEFDETVRFLSEVVGMGEPDWADTPGATFAKMMPGWPVEVDSRRVVLGSPPGQIEVVAIPAPLYGIIKPGVASVGFATMDVESSAGRAASAGFDVRPVLNLGGIITAGVVVGGQAFRFTRFPR